MKSNMPAYDVMMGQQGLVGSPEGTNNVDVSAITIAVGGMMGLKAAADHLGITEKTLRALVAKRNVKFFQVAPRARIRFCEEWLDELIARHTINTVEETQQTKQRRKKGKKHDTGDFRRHGLFSWE